MNITLPVDARIARQARAAAATMGNNLNQAVRDHLEQLAGSQPLTPEPRVFEQSASASRGRLDGWRFGRKDANRRA